jgi:hypothetical protein
MPTSLGRVLRQSIALVALLALTLVSIPPDGTAMDGRTGAPRPVRGATIHLASGVVGLAVGDGALWVSGEGVVDRIDPASARVVARIRTPRTGDYSNIAVGLGSVWVTGTLYRSVVYRIDPRADRVVATVHLAGPVQGIAVGAGSVWVTRIRQGPGELLRIDPATDRVAGAPVKVGPGPVQVIYGLHALWVQNSAPPSVMRVDPTTGRVATIGEADAGPGGAFTGGAIATGYGSLWSAYGDNLKRLNPKTGAILASIRIPRALAIAIGGGEEWVFSQPRSRSPTLFNPIRNTAALWEIDPRANRIVGKPLKLKTLDPIAVAASARNLWAADYSSRTVTQFRLVR